MKKVKEMVSHGWFFFFLEVRKATKGSVCEDTNCTLLLLPPQQRLLLGVLCVVLCGES